MAETALLIERLLRFSLQHSLITELDEYVARNTLLDLFGLSEPWSGEVPEEHLDVPTEILEGLLDCAAEKGLFDNEVPALRVNFEARIMGAVMPRESEVAAKFDALWKTGGSKAATDYFYDLCIVSNYIRTAQIAKNIQWDLSLIHISPAAGDLWHRRQHRAGGGRAGPLGPSHPLPGACGRRSQQRRSRPQRHRRGGPYAANRQFRGRCAQRHAAAGGRAAGPSGTGSGAGRLCFRPDRPGLAPGNTLTG